MHSQASPGSGRACGNAHLIHECADPLRTPQSGRKRPEPRDTSSRVSELFRETAGNRGWPHTLTGIKADISGNAQEPFNEVPDLYYCHSTFSQTMLRTFYCTLWSLPGFPSITCHEKRNSEVKIMSKLAEHIVHQNTSLLFFFTYIHNYPEYFTLDIFSFPKEQRIWLPKSLGCLI